MARTGRPPNKIQRIPWRVYIRADLAAQVELLLMNSATGRVRYGTRGELLEQLLEDWMATIRHELLATEDGG